MKDAVIITAADERYFGYLQGLLASIEQHRQGDLPVVVLDLGFNAQQLERLKTSVHQVVQPVWDVEFPERATAPGWFRAMTARPFLPRYTEGFERIIWLDSDAWLQDWRAIDLLMQASEHGKMAIVPELHRAYSFHYGRGKVLQNVYECARAGWGEDVAARLVTMPILNSGAFALDREAKHWDVWSRALEAGVQRTTNWLVEQTALNLAIYRDACPVHLLPAWCNWVCQHAVPVVDRQRRCLCEMYLPYEKLSLVHLTDRRDQVVKLAAADGDQMESKLNYEDVQSLLNGLPDIRC
ncbi:MAG TPA: hypothetical protein VF669_13835 [Tepidisphaeraceae bacterium]|jgi:hypothetical protein